MDEIGFDINIPALSEIGDNFESLEKESEANQIPYNEIFNEEFMRRNTNFSSFDEFIEAGGWEQSYFAENFDSIPNDVLDVLTKNTTHFSNWETLVIEATNEYVFKRLGFK